jgi:hypothetical protein
MLNKDQEKAISVFKNWWISSSKFAVLEGEAGTGKTYLVSHLVKELYNCVPLFTAPTNEACRQLELVLPENSLIKTTYSALGFNMTTHGELKELKQGKYSNVLNDVNLIIVDEASMIGEVLLQALIKTGMKVLLIGHRYQLPEVNINLKPDDLCKSIVFEQGYLTHDLTINQRATGDLYQFTKGLSEIIYTQPRYFKSTYNISEIALLERIITKDVKEEFLTEQAKLICYSNFLVDRYNKIIRSAIFGKFCPDILPKDKLILTAPVKFIGNLNKVSKTAMLKMKDKAVTLSTNSKLVVKKVNLVNVLGVDCHELIVFHKENEIPIYVPIDKRQLEDLDYQLKTECFAVVSKTAREKAWNNYHFIISLFANCKYSYAMTTHRAQGMTIDNVYVNWKNIKECSNIYLRYKLLYVAASRVRNNLYIVNGG